MGLSRRALILAAAAGPRFAQAAEPRFAQAAEPRFAQAAEPSTLVCPLAAEPALLIPGVSDAFATRFIGGKIYRGLMRYGPDGTLQPDLASAAGVSADRLTYLFRLRTGVTWHDSGAFDATDVVFSLARFHAALQPALRLGRVRVEAADAQTVVLRLSAPDDLSLRQLDALSLPIVPQHVHDVPGWALDPRAVAPVGTGPFRVAQWLRLVRFDWYAGPRAALDTLDCPVMPDPAARLALAERAPVLLVGDTAGLSMVAPLQAVPGLAVEADYPPAGRNVAGLRMNPATKPLDRPELRQALAYAVDREAVARQAWSRLARVATGPLLAGSPGRNEAAVLPGYDPRAAAERLNAAGLRPDDSGIRARLRYLHPPGPPWDRVFPVLRAALRQVGIELTAELVSAADWAWRAERGDYELTGFVAAQAGEPAADLAPYEALLPALRPLLASGQLDDAQAALVAAMPVLWLVEPGCPVVRDRRLSLPGGIFGDFSRAELSPP